MNTLSWIVEGSFSTRLTLALLHFLWQGCAGGLVVIIGGWLLREAAARSRYVLNVATMLLMAACLPVTFLLLDTPDSVTDRVVIAQGHEGHELDTKSPGPTTESALQGNSDLIGSDEPAVTPGSTPLLQEPAQVAPDPVPQVMRFPSFASMLSTSAFGTLARWVAVLYLTGVALILGRLLRGVWGGDRLRKMASPIEDAELLRTVSQLSQRLGLTVVPTVKWCEQISIPVVVGIITPMVLLPLSVASGLTPTQLQALLLHELSHIRRFDPIVNLLQRIVEAALFFHPVVWFVSRRISIERELAADDMVLAAGWDRPLYADALVRVAELAANISGSDMARRATALGASGTNPSEFKARVLRLLGEAPPPKLDLTRVGIAMTLLLLVVGGTIAWSQSDKPEQAAAPNKLVEDNAEITRAPEDEIVITGRVTDARGEPVANALVVYPFIYDLEAEKLRTVKGETDQAGAFRLMIKRADMSPGSKPGLFRATVWAWADGHAIGVAHAGGLWDLKMGTLLNRGKPVSIQLPARSRSVFVVKTDTGKPLADATVLPLMVRVPNGDDPIDGLFGLYDRLPDAFLNVAKGITDTEGRVVIDIVPRSQFDSVEVVSKSYGTQSAILTRQAEEQVIPMRAVGSLSGQLVGGPAELRRGVRLFLTTSGQSEGHAEVTTDQNGSFDVPAIASGFLRISSNLNPQQPWRFVYDKSFTIQSGFRNELALDLAKGIPVTGRLVVRGGTEPVSDAELSVSSNVFTNRETCTTDARGEFQTFVVPGDAAVTQVVNLATHAELAYPEKTQYRTTIPNDVDSFRIPDIEIPKAKIWTGRLVDQLDRPITGKYVQAYDGTPPLDHPARTHADGTFELKLRDDQIPNRWSALINWKQQPTDGYEYLPTEVVTADPLVLRVTLPDVTTTFKKPPLLLPDHWIVTAVGFDKDGKELVTASIQSFTTIRRWDLVNKKLISEIKLESDKHGRPLREETLTLSADRRKVIAATDAYVGIWDTATGKLLKQLPIPKMGQNDTVRLLTCTPDLSVIVGNLTTNYTRLTLRYDTHTIVWNANSDKAFRILTHKGQNELIGMSVSADGKRLATTNGGGAFIWDTTTGEQLVAVTNDNSGRKHSDAEAGNQFINNVWSIQFSPDGKVLAMGDTLGVKLLDSTSGQLVRELDGPYRYGGGRGRANLIFSKDGQLLARLGTSSETDAVIPIWSTQTGEMLFELYTNSNDAAFSDDGQRLAVAFSDLQQALTVWQLNRNGKDPEQTEGPGPEPRQDKVEQNGHYRGQTAAEFIESFKPTWSNTKLGIQYGIALTKPQRQFRSGERVPLVAFFRNASNKPLKIDMRPDYLGNAPDIIDTKGTVIELENIPLVGHMPHYVETLAPGEAVGPFYFSFGLGENPRPGKQHWHPLYKTPASGTYTLTHSVPATVGGPNDGDPSQAGDITSGQVEFEIIDGVKSGN